MWISAFLGLVWSFLSLVLGEPRCALSHLINTPFKHYIHRHITRLRQIDPHRTNRGGGGGNISADGGSVLNVYGSCCCVTMSLR